jgi:hypothetical protein
MITHRGLVRVAGLLALVVFAGCSPSGSFSRVSGKVTFNGEPIEGARVTFVGTTETREGGREEYYTTTDSSGKYAISGVRKSPGIPPGVYKVVVTKLTLKGGAKLSDGLDLTQLEMSGLGTNALPKEYGSAQTTKLSAELDPGKNSKDLELKSR